MPWLARTTGAGVLFCFHEIGQTTWNNVGQHGPTWANKDDDNNNNNNNNNHHHHHDGDDDDDHLPNSFLPML